MRCTSCNLRISAIHGSAGKLGISRVDGAKGPDGFRSETAICAEQPINGQPGQDAPISRGSRGSDGTPGIGTSPVTLDISDSSGLKVEIELNPGVGGQGGAGSIHKGGRGGAPGPNPDPGVCNHASKGADGNDSLRGFSGDSAAHGSCGVIRATPTLIQRIKLKDFEIDTKSKTTLNCSRKTAILRGLDEP